MKKLYLISSITIVIYLTYMFLYLPCQREVTKWEGFVPYLTGTTKPTTYLILLGNDTEARANGGFAGSYAKITLSSSTCTIYHVPCTIYHVPCTIDPKVSFHDIYVPNGQILNQHVTPPEPIQQAFGQGTWMLANADFDPDFPTAATSLRWFFEKGGEINPDLLVIINLTTIKKVLDVVGTFEVPEYQATLSPENLYLFLQGKTETNFFPGSTQKADALHNVGTGLIKKIKKLSLSKKYRIAQILYQDFYRQNLVVNSRNSEFQNFLLENKLAGQYLAPDTFDFFGLVEMNLGANKANQYVTRQTQHTITSLSPMLAPRSPNSREALAEWNSVVGSREGSGEGFRHQISISFYNSSPESNPNPPLHYGGNYLAYLRLYLPPTATNITIDHTLIATSSALANPDILNHQIPQIITCTIYHVPCTIYGFWHLTLAGQSSQINLSYDLPFRSLGEGGLPYSLTLLKQNGFPTSPQSLTIFDKKFETDLSSPFVYPK